MKTVHRLGLLFGICLISVQGSWAFDSQNSGEVGNYHGPTSNTYRQDSDNPKEKLGETTGSIKSIDGVTGNISVMDDKGTLAKFVVEANTRIEDHHLQISLSDLHLGDRILVHFNIDPQLVNSIDRL